MFNGRSIIGRRSFPAFAFKSAGKIYLKAKLVTPFRRTLKDNNERIAREVRVYGRLSRDVIQPLWRTLDDHVFSKVSGDLERKRSKMATYVTRLDGNLGVFEESCDKVRDRLESGVWTPKLALCPKPTEW